MTDLHEPSYLEGERAALRRMLSDILHRLDADADDPQLTIARLTKEREDTIAALRSVCRDHGDNEWEPSAYVADVVDKHLGRNLSADSSAAIRIELDNLRSGVAFLLDAPESTDSLTLVEMLNARLHGLCAALMEAVELIEDSTSWDPRRTAEFRRIAAPLINGRRAVAVAVAASDSETVQRHAFVEQTDSGRMYRDVTIRRSRREP